MLENQSLKEAGLQPALPHTPFLWGNKFIRNGMVCKATSVFQWKMSKEGQGKSELSKQGEKKKKTGTRRAREPTRSGSLCAAPYSPQYNWAERQKWAGGRLTTSGVLPSLFSTLLLVTLEDSGSLSASSTVVTETLKSRVWWSQTQVSLSVCFLRH